MDRKEGGTAFSTSPWGGSGFGVLAGAGAQKWSFSREKSAATGLVKRSLVVWVCEKSFVLTHRKDCQMIFSGCGNCELDCVYVLLIFRNCVDFECFYGGKSDLSTGRQKCQTVAKSVHVIRSRQEVARNGQK